MWFKRSQLAQKPRKAVCCSQHNCPNRAARSHATDQTVGLAAYQEQGNIMLHNASHFNSCLLPLPPLTLAHLVKIDHQAAVHIHLPSHWIHSLQFPRAPHCCCQSVFRGFTSNPERSAIFVTSCLADFGSCSDCQQGGLLQLSSLWYIVPAARPAAVRIECHRPSGFLSKAVRTHNPIAP